MAVEKSLERRTILMADDDVEDCLLVRDAMAETGRACEMHFVRDGNELFDYLRHEGEYIDGRNAPWPDLILLDLKMPCKDGRETIRDLKSDPRYRRIPVVVLTTSSACDDVEASYDNGANAYIAKPTTFHDLVEMVEALGKYWFDMVELPPKARHGRKES
jgi:CheY-like chemotaxis protein